MISRERLKELKYNTIYSTFGGISRIYLDDDTFLKDDKLYEKDRKYGDLFVGNLKNLYETKEDAEFVQKFHTRKIIYFEPPTWEEFLRTQTDDAYACWEIQKIAIIMDTESKCFFITDNLSCVWESFSYTDENKKQKYYEAVEYAKKLFKGEK